MKRLRIVVGCLIVCVTLSGTALADDPGWTLRFYGALVDAPSQAGVSVGDVSAGADLGGGGGVGVGAEYRFSKRVGLEMSFLFASIHFDASVEVGSKTVSQSFEMGMVPLTLAVPIHFQAGKRMDLFVAPSFSRVAFMDFEVKIGSGGVQAGWNDQSSLALGLGVGFDLALGKKQKWAFSSSLRAMKTEVQGTGLDPFIMTVGAAYRF